MSVAFIALIVLALCCSALVGGGSLKDWSLGCITRSVQCPSEYQLFAPDQPQLQPALCSDFGIDVDRKSTFD